MNKIFKVYRTIEEMLFHTRYIEDQVFVIKTKSTDHSGFLLIVNQGTYKTRTAYTIDSYDRMYEECIANSVI